MAAVGLAACGWLVRHAHTAQDWASRHWVASLPISAILWGGGMYLLLF